MHVCLVCAGLCVCVLYVRGLAIAAFRILRMFVVNVGSFRGAEGSLRIATKFSDFCETFSAVRDNSLL